MSTKEQEKEPDTLVLSRPKLAFILALCLVPTGLALLSGGFSSAGEAGNGWAIPEVSSLLSGPVMYYLVQVTGITIAVFAAMLCFAHFMHTGEVTTPVLGVGLLCASVIDIWQTMATDNLMPMATAPEIFVPLSWTMSRAFYALVIISAASLLLVSSRARGARQRQKVLTLTAGCTIGFVAVAATMVLLFATTPDFAAKLYSTKAAQLGWNLAPLALFLFAAFYVMPTYLTWHRTALGQMLFVSCIVLAIGQAHFAFGGQGWFAPNFIAANLLKICGYLIPLVGLMLEYEWTQARLSRSNKDLQDKLFLLEQSQQVAGRKEQVLTALMETLPEPVYLVDSSLRITQMNDSFARLLNLETSFVAFGKDIGQFIDEASASQRNERCAQVMKEAEAVLDTEETATYPDGREHAFRWNYSPVLDTDGRPVGVLCVGSSRRRAAATPSLQALSRKSA